MGLASKISKLASAQENNFAPAHAPTAPPSPYTSSPSAPMYDVHQTPPSQYPVLPVHHHHQPCQSLPSLPAAQSLPYLPAALSDNTGNTKIIEDKLRAIIKANSLGRFYDSPNAFAEAMRRATRVNYSTIAAKWNVPLEIVYDFAPLALYDVFFYCDDSGSMKFEEGGERITDLRFILSKVAEIVSEFDDDGISVRFINSDVQGDNLRTERDVTDLVNKVPFTGLTPLGTSLNKKILQPLLRSHPPKPTIVYVITDGAPSGEPRDTFRNVVANAKDLAISFIIAQVGKDTGAQAFLHELDNDPVVGNQIDCTSYYEMEEAEFAAKGVTLTPYLWLVKLMCGFDPSSDNMD